MSISHHQPSSIITSAPKLVYSAATTGALYNEDLLAAAESGDDSFVCELLAQNANINICTLDGNSALHLAALKNHPSTTDLLLQNGADFSAKNSNQNTALHLAAQKGFHEIVRQLILRGADGNALNLTQKTPLQLAEASLKKVRGEIAAAEKFKEILRTPAEILLQMEVELENLSQTTSLLKVQQTVLNQISATPLKSQQQTNAQTL